jgi:hypothetical protein
LFGHRPELVRIDANVPWEVVCDPENGWFLGICRLLSLNAIRRHPGGIPGVLNEAMQLLFEAWFREGELDAFLQRHGWSTLTPLPPPRAKMPTFDVPFEVQRKNRLDQLGPALITVSHGQVIEHLHEANFYKKLTEFHRRHGGVERVFVPRRETA